MAADIPSEFDDRNTPSLKLCIRLQLPIPSVQFLHRTHGKILYFGLLAVAIN
jgi:hypothetical protein